MVIKLSNTFHSYQRFSSHKIEIIRFLNACFNRIIIEDSTDALPPHYINVETIKHSCIFLQHCLTCFF